MPPASRRRGRALGHTVPEALRRAVPLLLSTYVFAAIASTLLPLEAVRRLQLSFPAPSGSKAAGSAAVVTALTLPPTAAPPAAPWREWLFPEARSPWFSLHSASSIECVGPLGPEGKHAGPQAVLQACLGSPWCACVTLDGGMSTSARLYSGHQPRLAGAAPDSPDAVVALRLGCGRAGEQQQQQQRRGSSWVPQPPCVGAHAAALMAAEAVRAASGSIVQTISEAASGGLCPPGMHPVSSTVRGIACSPCPRGYCGLLPGAELLPASSLDAPLQAAVAASPFSADSALQMRAFNPSVLLWQGRRTLFARASNISSCSSQGSASSAAAWLAVASRIVVCDLGDAASPAEAQAPRHCRRGHLEVTCFLSRHEPGQMLPSRQHQRLCGQHHCATQQGVELRLMPTGWYEACSAALCGHPFPATPAGSCLRTWPP